MATAPDGARNDYFCIRCEIWTFLSSPCNPLLMGLTLKLGANSLEVSSLAISFVTLHPKFDLE